MLSPKLHSKIRELWNMFWSAGMTNPLVAIEQITYLLFLRQLEKLDEQRIAAGKPSLYTPRPNIEGVHTDYSVCKWSYLRRNVSFDLLNRTVFPWLRGLQKWLESLKAAEDVQNGDAQAEADDAPHDDIIGQLDDAHFALDRNKTTTLTSAVELIDKLFAGLDADSPGADLMGDIFEDLLDEITSSGKNGQFRTPRHIIRFMVELVDPEPGKTILDPACGTGGFLFNTLLHWQRKYSAPEDLRLEWDGTPHRLNHVFPDELKERLNDCFHGYDNDKSMVRVAWMNLVLHGLTSPHVSQLDSLSKRLPDEASGTYDYIFANPPFAGKIDKGDLSALVTRFPRGKGDAPITNDTELLFVWLILDLLKPGGRAAVIVPEGVLTGTTNAHHKLRRDLLWEHALEAVVSLPSGVFNPYAGVKTSIIVFQKAGEEKKPGDDPRTREVWFYEVNEEARSLDQRRKARFTGPNDLWDALVKFRGGAPFGLQNVTPRDTSTRYFQPRYDKQRWRQIDGDFVRIFPDHASQKGQLLGVHEVFRELPANPEGQTDEVCGRWEEQFTQMIFHSALAESRRVEGPVAEPLSKRVAAFTSTAADKLRRKIQSAAAGVLDSEFEKHGLQALRACIESAADTARKFCDEPDFDADGFMDEPPSAEPELLAAIVKTFALVDGFDVWLRSADVFEQPAKNDDEPQLSWFMPVRQWAVGEDWGEPPDGAERVALPTHEGPDPRPDYLNWLRNTLHVFDNDATVKRKFRSTRLELGCIEAADLSISAGRHKPPDSITVTHRSPVELIIELQEIHGKLSDRLTTLLAMVQEGEMGPGHNQPRRRRRNMAL